MNPLTSTAAQVQGGVSEFTAPCAFDPIYTFLSYNYTYNSYFLMARDGVTIIINKHLFHTIEAGFDAGPHSFLSSLQFFSPGGTLVEHSNPTLQNSGQ